MVARDWSESRIVLWLNHLGQEIGAPRWRPKAPHRVIAAALHRSSREDSKMAIPAALEAEHDQQPVTGPPATEEYRRARETVRRNGEIRQAQISPVDPQEAGREWSIGEFTKVRSTDRQLENLRDASKADPAFIRTHAAVLGRDSALEMFGPEAARILDGDDVQAQTGFRVLTTAQPA
jgi:hypothetical protein